MYDESGDFMHEVCILTFTPLKGKRMETSWYGGCKSTATIRTEDARFTEKNIGKG